MNWRIRVLQLIFISWTFLILGRLGYWQIVKAADLKSAAVKQYGALSVIPALRGEIKSSDGFPLVTNSDAYLLYAEPGKLPDNKRDLDKLISLLPASDSAKKILTEARDNGQLWVILSHRLSPDLRRSVELLKITGLGFETEPNRIYPEGTASAYFTGFVGKDTSGQPRGYFGLEGYYDRILTGEPGRLIQERDVFNKPILIGGSAQIPPRPGKTLTTSIDRTLQFLATRKLSAALEKYQAVSGTVSVMDTRTGRILAMVAIPGYDPSSYQEYSDSLYKNPVISEGYEPGSTFKVVVMSAALDAGTVKPDTVCSICTGPVELSGKWVKSYNDKYYPNSNMWDVILHSDNVGMVFVGRTLGRNRLLEYIRKFGFGVKTGIDLQEEDTPLIRPNDEWRDIDWGTTCFGQGIAVTRLQMLTAVNAIANSGLLMPPRIVTRIDSQNSVKAVEPQHPVRIISPKAASQMTQMMVNGVERGEVRYYKNKGYKIAGKTGTAQVPIEGHYDEEKTIASFVGFAPAQDPRFTMLVTLKEPKTSPWGSTTAAPLWFDIASDLFRYYRIPPEL
ncbi:MAG: Peptidoglycan glycosyltransferase [Candidatus Amesbacteria bacterium GW2011_GWB1_47_19]|nr:MAG: Peptidoglycan glycosyltransferase [Candidatus Amesbacteria bacterium GW2011_GWA1_44_24]KKU30948.1 MAG: Peptidoglycan glycosyltransferase [Candidatus Amesbacteria bacterium GW2011_GWC1_46_24]KKU66611.1 MAG: Peptidoglycan glycosyltransferase [Candidatus Amesbacteria bacterium GW2011_GWB1_47_19]OGD05331.1 MAG: hypothetical protein A2379_01245 [Candidatus Amesbacteria bacterium RIFOXYB1_FULL_47_13]HBC73214.1 hypothetical protein [Candidatus Amesbacteria bacterium]